MTDKVNPTFNLENFTEASAVLMLAAAPFRETLPPVASAAMAAVGVGAGAILVSKLINQFSENVRDPEFMCDKNFMRDLKGLDLVSGRKFTKTDNPFLKNSG